MDRARPVFGSRVESVLVLVRENALVSRFVLRLLGFVRAGEPPQELCDLGTRLPRQAFLREG